MSKWVEWLVCTDLGDPGGTEVWSDVRIDRGTSDRSVMFGEKAARQVIYGHECEG